MLYADALSNLFDDLPSRLPAERVDVVVDAPGVRVERIVCGHAVEGEVDAEGAVAEDQVDSNAAPKEASEVFGPMITPCCLL